MNRLCKVLIVDDEFLVRQGIKHHMNWEAEGFIIVVKLPTVKKDYSR